jgi:hypothetical protein
MRVRTLFIVAMATISCGVFLTEAPGGRQSVALFPPRTAGVEDGTRVSSLLGQALAEKLRDRFDVRMVGQGGMSDPEERKRKARSLGATYVLTGNVSRIGRTATLDLTLAPTENPGKGRTVFVTAEEKGGGAEEQRTPGNADLPFTYRRMATEASAKLKLHFFGDGQIGEGDTRRKIPSLSGKVSRSRNLSGDVISLSVGDTDRDGKPEIAAGQSDSVVIYQMAGKDLVEKARIPEARQGLLHIDVADVNRNGIAEIVSVHYLSGRAISDVWEFDGKEYRRIAKDIPYFLRTVDLGPEGIVLVGQKSDPVTIYTGPVFRIVLDRYGLGELSEQAAPTPLPPGTWIYSFVPVSIQGELRYVSLGEKDRLLLLDGKGGKIWESIDVVSRTEMVLEAAVAGLPGSQGETNARRLSLPGRLFAADLDGDKTDEIVLVNNIVSAGGFFENLRIFTNAEVLCFGQYGDRLELAWRTPQIESPARDAFLDVTPGGKSFRIGIASRDNAKILGKFGEWRLYWVK